jgi:hypothetical protein
MSRDTDRDDRQVTEDDVAAELTHLVIVETAP